ncbi:MAG TPA: efflux RND transporter periplasmic adaptor subunit [Opitutaceae bacterium]|nr:efflux RND transporter periplasmic adaptor subunit [Opitutaceae bacterium]
MHRFVLLLSSLVFVGACSRHEPAVTSASLPPAAVRLTTVRTESLPVATEVTGLVRPVQRANVAAKVMGVIEEMPVTLGQSVRAGDLLVKISAGEISARVAQARSQLNAARRDLNRERDLLTKGASTADMVKGLEDRFAAAEAMVREADVMLGYTEIRAPFDGVIARKLSHPGDLASPGYPLLEIEGTHDFQVEVGVPDSLASRLAPGARVGIEVPAAGVTFNGSIAELSSAADAGALTVLAKIAVPAGLAVRSGQFARVQISGEPAPALMVPVSAVSQIGQMQRVFVAADQNRAQLRLVKTGAVRGDRVEILAGLDDGDRIVVDPPVGLREGQPLQSQ